MPGLQELKILESDPEFWQFSYTDQLKIRQRVLSKVLPEEPGFDQLNQVQQALVYRKILLSPPKFENKQFEAWVSKNLQNMDLSKEEDVQNLRSIIDSDATMRSMGLSGTVSKWLDPIISLKPQRGEGRTIGGPPIVGPWDYYNAPKNMTMYEFNYGKDKRKLVEFLSQAYGDKIPNFARNVRRAQAVGKALDWGIFTLATAGASFGVGPLGQATVKAGQVVEAAAMRHGLTWLRHFAPHLIVEMGLQGLVEGGGDVLRDWLTVSLAKDAGVVGPGVERTVGDYLKIFGLGAARDFAYGFVGATFMKLAPGVPRVIRKYSDANDAIRKATDSEFAKLIEVEARGQGIPDRVLSRAPEHVQERVLSLRGIKDSLENYSKVAPGGFREMQIQAWNTGNSLIRKPSGYTLRSFAKPADVINAKNLREVRDALVERAGKMGEKKILSSNPLTDPLIAQYEMNKLVNHAFDPLATAEKTKPAISARKRAVKKGEYISPSARQYLNPSEAEISAARASKNGGSVFRVRAETGLDAGEISRLKKGNYIDTYQKTFDVGNPLNDADTLIVSMRAAPYSEYQAALKLEGDTDLILLRHGYDSAFVDEAGTKLMVLRPSGVKFVSDTVNPATGKFGAQVYQGATPEAAVKNASNELFIRQKLTAAIPLRELGGDEQLMSRLLASGIESGKVNKDILRDFVNVYLAKRGISPDQYANLILKETPSKAAVRAAFHEGNLIVALPKELPSGGAERVFVRSLIDQLESSADAFAVGFKRSTRATREIADNFLKQYGKILRKGRIWTTRLGGELASMKYLRSLGEKTGAFSGLVQSGGKIQLLGLEGKVVRTFDNMDEAFQEILPSIMNKSDVERVASFNRARLRKVNDTYQIYSYTEGKVIGTGKTPGEAMKDADLDFKIPPRHMPNVVLIDDGAATIEVSGLEVTTKNMQEGLKFLDMFDMKYTDAKLAFKGDTINAYKVGSSYIVEDTTLGHWEKFKNIGEARKYFDEVLEDPKKILDVSTQKGIDIQKVGNEYDVFVAGKYYHAADTDELRKLFADSPTPKEAPELVDVNGDLGEIQTFIDEQADYFKGLDIDFKGGFKPVDWLKVSEAEALADVPLRLKLTSWFRPVDDVLVQMVKNSGHGPIMENFIKMEDALRGAERETSKYMAQIERALQVPGSHGKLKMMDKPRRQALYQYMTAKAEDVDQVVKDLKITDDEIAAADKLRTILGRDRTSGLFAQLIDDPNSFLFDYLPRFLKDYKNLPKKVLVSSKKNIDIVNHIAGNKYVPKEITFAANQERLSDLLMVAVDDDVYSALKKYVSLGMKRYYVGPVWEQFGTYMRKNVQNIPPALRETVAVYQQQVMGIPQSYGLKTMRDVGQELAKKLKLDRGVTDNLISSYFALSYMTNMGLRPWLVWRNMHQVFTTLAPKFGLAGNEVVGRAAKLAAGKEGQLMYEHLQELGEITGRYPVFADLPGEQTLLGRITQFSLAPYKSSDEYTRVVVALAAKDRWDEAVELLKNGKIRPDQFMEFSAANMIDAPYQNQILGFLREGKFNEGMDVYINRLIRDTMFDYRPAMRPRWFNASALGKIFGMYGTYSVNYAANLMKAFRNGTKAQKIAFATRFLANSFGFYAIYKSLGINAANFLPWQPLQFSGGPVWNHFVTATEAIGGGYQGREARAQFRGIAPFNLFDALTKGEDVDWSKLPSWIPGTMQYRDIRRAAEYMQEGDIFRATSSLMSMPVVPDSPEVYDAILDLYPTPPYSPGR